MVKFTERMEKDAASYFLVTNDRVKEMLKKPRFFYCVESQFFEWDKIYSPFTSTLNLPLENKSTRIPEAVTLVFSTVMLSTVPVSTTPGWMG